MGSTAVSPHPLHLLLPRLGTEEDFAALRQTLAACGFHNEGICGRLEIPSIVEFKGKCEGRPNALEIEQPIDVLIRLLLDGEFVSEDSIDFLLPSGTRPVLERLQLVVQDEQRPGEWFSPISMYPAGGGLLLAGDRPGTPDGSKYWLPPDVVYPGIVENTRNFLAGLPETPCEALLDLGTGSGIAALLASRYARQAWGADIASRSARFAEFNRRLNGIENVTIVEGDLYDAVAGLTFDRIVTHPPYVPAPKNEMIFRDGGWDGEQILQRAIAGLPQHLRVGGRFYTLVLGADLEDETFEDRIRTWLGLSQGEFDLVMVSHSLRPPTEFVAKSVAGGKIQLNDLKFWTETWIRRKAQFLFYGSILIRRHDRQGPAITVRVQKGEGFRAAHQEWLLDWMTDCRQPGATDFLFDLHPEVAPGVELHVLHRHKDGRFSAEMFGLESKQPFTCDLRCAPWTIALISECNGATSWREHFERALKENLVSSETTPDEFAGLLEMLVSQSILRVPERLVPTLA
jgi:carbamoyltransferase